MAIMTHHFSRVIGIIVYKDPTLLFRPMWTSSTSNEVTLIPWTKMNGSIELSFRHPGFFLLTLSIFYTLLVLD
jgi:hypothetical protein